MALRALAALVCLGSAAGYSSGFTSACREAPNHGSTGTATGYTITLKEAVGAVVTSWAAGQSYTVEIARSGGSFRGFVMAVFPGSSRPASFSNAKAGTLGGGSLAQVMGGCAGGVTHVSGTDKTLLVLSWTPPASGTGAVTFFGIVVVARLGENHYVTQSWPEATAAVSGSGTASGTLAATPTGSVSAAAPSVSSTASASLPASATGTSSPAAPSGSGSGTATSTPSVSGTVTATGSGTISGSGARTPSGSLPPSASGSLGASASGTATGTPSGVSGTGTGSASGTGAATPSATQSHTQSLTGTGSGAAAPSGSATGTQTPSGSGSGGAAPSGSGTASSTGTQTRSAAATVAVSSSGTGTGAPSRTASPSPQRQLDAWGAVGTVVPTGDPLLPYRVALLDESPSLRVRVWYGTRPGPGEGSDGYPRADFRLEAAGNRWLALAPAAGAVMLAPTSGFAVIGRVDTGSAGAFALNGYETARINAASSPGLANVGAGSATSPGPSVAYNATSGLTTLSWSRPLEALVSGDRSLPTGAASGFIWAVGPPGGAWATHDRFGYAQLTLPPPTAGQAACSRADTCGGRGTCVNRTGVAPSECRCDLGYAGPRCDRCAPPAYRTSGGACALPSNGLSGVVRAILRVPLALSNELNAPGSDGLFARGTFARNLRNELRAALRLLPPSINRRRQLQAGTASAILEVPSSTAAVLDFMSGEVSVNLTVVAGTVSPSAAGPNTTTLDVLMTRLTELLGSQAPDAPAPALASSSVARYLDGAATLGLLAADSASGSAFAPLLEVAPPATHAFTTALDHGMTLSWTPAASRDRVYLTLTCATGGAWCGVGLNDRPAMTGALAVALEPGQPEGAQCRGWALGGRDRASVGAVSLDAPASPIFVAGGTPVTVTVSGSAGAGTISASWAWPVGSLPGQISLGSEATLIYAVGRGGVLGPHDDTTSGAAIVHFGTGVVARVGLSAKPSVWAHAVLMLLGWAALAPAGVAVARYCKGLVAPAPALGSAAPPPAPWFPAHWKLQLLGQACSALGVIIVFATRSPGVAHIRTRHEALGLAVFLLGLLQPLLAQKRVRPGKPAPPSSPAPESRVAWEAMHKTLGYGALLAAFPAVFLGIAQASPAGHQAPLLTGLFAGYLAFVGLGFAALEVRMRTRSATAPLAAGTRGGKGASSVAPEGVSHSGFAIADIFTSAKHAKSGGAPVGDTHDAEEMMDGDHGEQRRWGGGVAPRSGKIAAATRLQRAADFLCSRDGENGGDIPPFTLDNPLAGSARSAAHTGASL